MSAQASLDLGLPPIPETRALSIRQPWAWLIVRPDIEGDEIRKKLCLEYRGFKDIENRTWQTTWRGRLLIHAAKGMTPEEYATAAQFAADRGVDELPAPEELDFGGVIGEVQLLDCVRESRSVWFTGPWGWVLRSPKAWRECRPCRALPGVFDPERQWGAGDAPSDETRRQARPTTTTTTTETFVKGGKYERKWDE